MLLTTDDIAVLCRNTPGLEAWILEGAQLLHFAEG
jgi:hypothetical protein